MFCDLVDSTGIAAELDLEHLTPFHLRRNGQLNGQIRCCNVKPHPKRRGEARAEPVGSSCCANRESPLPTARQGMICEKHHDGADDRHDQTPDVETGYTFRA
jgi:hypothetical protein